MKLLIVIMAIIPFGTPGQSLTASKIAADSRIKTSSADATSETPFPRWKTTAKISKNPSENLSKNLAGTKEEPGKNFKARPKIDSMDVPSTSDFAEIRLMTRAFVDKTDFIHEWLSHKPKYWHIIAPPGFGKSSLLSMLRYFCNLSAKVVNGTLQILNPKDTETDELFHGTMISGIKDFFSRHFQNNAVVSINFSPLRNVTDAKSLFDSTCGVIQSMVSDYLFLHTLKGLDKAEKALFEGYKDKGINYCLGDAKKAVKYHGPLLVKALKKHTGREVIVLADDVDAALYAVMENNFKTTDDFVHDMFMAVHVFVEGLVTVDWGRSVPAKSLFMSSFDLKLLKPDEHRMTAFGSPSGTVGLSRLRSTDCFRDKRIANFFGLTWVEAQKLLEQYALGAHSRDLADLYDGYAIIASETRLYNTRSVFNFIQARGVPTPVTPCAILRGFERLFADDEIGRDITTCVFRGSVVVVEQNDRTRYTHLISLKRELTGVSALETNFSLELDQYAVFIILLRLGLVKVIEYSNWKITLTPANRVNEGILRDYMYKSGFTERYFKIKARDEAFFINAIKGLAPNNASIQIFGDAITNIVTADVITINDALLRSLIYLYARKAAEHYSNDILVAADVPAHIKEGKEFEKSGERIKEGVVDVLLVEKKKETGVIIKVTEYDAADTLRNALACRYYDVFETNPVYSKLNIEDKVVIGICVPKYTDWYEQRLLKMAAEVRGAVGSLKLEYLGSCP